MPERTLRFRIRQDGLVEESVEGLVGDRCHQLTERLEEALGTVVHTQSTSDAFQSSQAQTELNSAELL